MSADLFGHSEFARTPAEAKRERRRAKEVCRGYYAPPGTGPAGETCRSCRHTDYVQYAKRFWKCARRSASWTHGPGTDIRLKSPACKGWEAKDP